MSIYRIDDSDQYQKSTDSSRTYSYAKSQIGENSTLTNYDYRSLEWTKNNNRVTIPIKVTKKYVTNNSFSIVNEGLNFSIATYLMVESRSKNKIDDNTKVSLYLKINNSTLTNISSAKINQNINNIDKIHLIIGTEDIITSSNSYTNEIPAIVEYHVNPDKTLGSYTIIQNGRLLEIPDSIAYEQVSETITSNIVNFFGGISSAWTAPIENIIVTDSNTENNFAYISTNLNSVAVVYREQEVLRGVYTDPSDQADLSINLSLNPRTILIKGGHGYVVGDTFTVSGGVVPGIIKVTSIDNNGAILNTSLIASGDRFSSVPVVNYDGVSGSSAEITYNDSFRIAGFTVNHGGNGYMATDSLQIYRDPLDLTEENLVGIDAQIQIETQIIGVNPKLNDKYSLDSVDVDRAGYDHEEAPYISLIDRRFNNAKIKNTNYYITSNADNFEDGAEIYSI